MSKCTTRKTTKTARRTAVAQATVRARRQRERDPMVTPQQEASVRASCGIGIDEDDCSLLRASHMDPNRGQLLWRMEGSAHGIRR
jgi:hypothetical protein